MGGVGSVWSQEASVAPVTGRDNATTAVVQVSKGGALTNTVAWGRGEGTI